MSSVPVLLALTSAVRTAVPPANVAPEMLRRAADAPARQADHRRLEAMTGLLLRTRNQRVRRLLYTRIRRAEDESWAYLRRIAKALYDVEIGKYSYGCYRLDWSIMPGSRIGAFCSFGADVRLGGMEHPTDLVSTHPFLQLRDRGFLEASHTEAFVANAAPVTVGDDVWIGHQVQVAGGITVGKGAVIGAGAVVTRDVPPYAVVAGVPARVLRSRFEPGLAARLEAIDWASWDDATIRARLPDFYDAEGFVERYG